MVNKENKSKNLETKAGYWYEVLETGSTNSNFCNDILDWTSSIPITAPVEIGDVKKPVPKFLSAEKKEQLFQKLLRKEKKIDRKVAKKMEEYNYPPIKVINTRKAEQALEDVDTEYNLFKVIEDIEI